MGFDLGFNVGRIDGYDYKKPYTLNKDDYLGFYQFMGYKVFWQSDIITHTFKVEKGNFSKIDELNVDVRIALVINKVNSNEGYTEVTPILEVKAREFSQFDEKNGGGYPILPDSYKGNVALESIKGIFKIKTNNEEIEMYFNARTNAGQYRDTQKYGFQRIMGYRNNTNVKPFKIYHDTKGKPFDLKIDFETNEEINLRFVAYNETGKNFQAVTHTVIPKINFSYVLKDDYIPIIPLKSTLSSKYSDNKVYEARNGRLLFNNYLINDKKHKVKHKANIKVANHFDSMIEYSQKKDKKLTQSYSILFSDIEFNDKMEFAALQRTEYRKEIKHAFSRAFDNRVKYLMNEDKYLEAFLGRKYIDKELTLIIEYITELDTYEYIYKQIEVNIAKDDFGQEITEYIIKDELIPKNKNDDFALFRKVGTHNALGQLVRKKPKKTNIKIKYVKPLYKDNVLISEKSKLLFEFEDGFDEDTSFDMFKIDDWIYSKKVVNLDNYDSNSYINDDGIYVKEIDISEKDYNNIKSGNFIPFASDSEFGHKTPLDNNSNFNGGSIPDFGDGSSNTNNSLNKIEVIGEIDIYDSDNNVVNITKNNKIIIKNKSTISVKLPKNFIDAKDNVLYNISVSLNDLPPVSIKYNVNNETTVKIGKALTNGTNVIKVILKDIENVTNEYSKEFFVYDYKEPTAQLNIDYRDISTNTMFIDIRAILMTINNNNKINMLKIRNKLSKGNNWSMWTTVSLDNILYEIHDERKMVTKLKNPLEIKVGSSYIDNTYDFEVEIQDIFKTTTKILIRNQGLGVPLIFFDEWSKGVGIGSFPVLEDSVTVKKLNFEQGLVVLEEEGRALSVDAEDIILGSTSLLAKIESLEKRLLDIESKN